MKPVEVDEAEKGRALAEYRAQYPEAWGFIVEWDEEIGLWVPVQKRNQMARCGGPRGPRVGHAPCEMWAGWGTAHNGVGRCKYHDSPVERAAGAWLVAHRMGQIMDVSPWDALLLAVKRCAAWGAFYEAKLGEVEDDDQLRPGGTHYDWVLGAERVNEKLARWSKMAVDAGVQKILVERAQTEGAYIARVLNAAIAAAGLDDDAEQRLRAALRGALLSDDPALEATTSSDEEGQENIG